MKRCGVGVEECLRSCGVSDSIYCIVGVAVLKQQSGYRPVFALCVCDWGRARGEGERRERRERDGEREIA